MRGGRDLLTAVGLFLTVGVALALRTAFQWSRVFGESHVSFQGGDPWYHMRLVDHMLRNFPHRITADPYLGYPDPVQVAVAPFFDVLVAAGAWVVGGGAPGERDVDVVGALLPAVLGAAIIVLVYALGVRLFDRRTGLIAAALVAVMPGNFLDRSRLGYADHHVLEVLLSMLTLLALVIASTSTRPRTYRLAVAGLAGVALGAYLLTWSSGAFLVGIVCIWVVVQRCIESTQGHASSVVPIVAMALVVALALVLAFQSPALPRYRSQLAALVGTLGVVGLLEVLRLVWTRARLPERLLPLGVLGSVAAGTAALAVVRPVVVARLLEDLARLAPGRAEQTVAEIRPLLHMIGPLSLRPLVQEFGSTFAVGLLGLGMLAVLTARSGRPDRVLALLATLAFGLATFGQNRFSYYLAPMLGLLSGWVGATALSWAAAPRARTRHPLWRWGRVGLVAVLIALVGIVPGLGLAIAQARAENDPRQGWRPALAWLRGGSPEPFGDPSFYWARYDGSAERRRPAYTVLAWWDYGYEIVRIARRVPLANPTQAGARHAARFFTATDEGAALALLDDMAARYVIVDADMPYAPRGPATIGGKFAALPLWAGQAPTRFVSTLYRRRGDGTLAPVVAFHPDYYRSMVVRLQVFGGRGATPYHSTWVIQSAERSAPDGREYRELLSARRFPTYEAALEFAGAEPHQNYTVVGLDPLRTCVPIEPLERLTLVHEAGGLTASGRSAVRIFEVVTR